MEKTQPTTKDAMTKVETKIDRGRTKPREANGVTSKVFTFMNTYFLRKAYNFAAN